uniref:Uncharacterized protein n=1 Tax=Cacopsylla melanoneura TaxID=428564 RepID=A0A8D8S868_9HEMI
MRKRIKRYFLCSIRSCWSLKFTMTNIIIVGALLLIGLCLVLSVDLSSTTPLEDIVAETSTSMPEERSEAFKPYWTWQCKYNNTMFLSLFHLDPTGHGSANTTDVSRRRSHTPHCTSNPPSRWAYASSSVGNIAPSGHVLRES